MLSFNQRDGDQHGASLMTTESHKSLQSIKTGCFNHYLNILRRGKVVVVVVVVGVVATRTSPKKRKEDQE